MSKSDSGAAKKERNKTIRWVVTIFFITILVSGTISFTSDLIMANSTMLVSGTISFLSDILMENSSMAVAFMILLAIILIGIVFDIIGMAVASADEKPFHAMAVRKVPGAKAAITLLRNAERVSSICNDVVGDICGVVSGSAAATIAAQILAKLEFGWPQIVGLMMSAICAGLTVGGKAIGKSFAVESCITIVHTVGKFIYWIQNFGSKHQKKK